MNATAAGHGPRQAETPWRRALALSAGGLMLLAFANTTLAAGFYLDVVGTPRSVGTAGAANVTNNSGPDAAWANPAGLTGIKDPLITTGLTVLAPFAEWDAGISEAGGIEGSNTGQPAVVPSLFYAQPLTDKWSFGFGLSALQGGGVDYGNNFVGRYGATEVALQGLGATWSFGYQATDKLSLGFGGSVIYTTFDEKIAINQGAVVPGAPDGQVEFKDLDDLGIQPIIGLQYRFTDQLMLGMTYRAEYDADLQGDIRFKNLAPVVPLPSQGNLEIEWTNPQWLEAGLAYKVTSTKHIWLSGNWQEWSKFSDNKLTIDLAPGAPPVATVLDREFKDTWAVSLGFGTRERDFDPGEERPNSGWTFGASYETSPVSDGKRTIDLPFDENIKLSASYFRQRRDKWDWSVGSTVQIFGDNRVDQTAQGARFTGEFDEFVVVYLTGTIRFLK